MDTSAMIDLFKKESALLSLLANIEDKIVSTIINYQEIMFGLDLSNIKYKTEFEYYESFFSEVDLVFLSKKASQKSSEVFWDLKKKGEMIDEFDSMVAGILLANGINKIITKNKKHFEKIKGLRVISY